MTQNQTLAAIRALGLTARVTDGEWRVAFKGIPADRAEATAHYTNDMEDAMGTARLMAAAGYKSKTDRITFTYDEWIDKQHANIAAQINAHARAGDVYDWAVYCEHSRGSVPGNLLLAKSTPCFPCTVIRFPRVSDKVMSVPRSHLRSLLWNACRLIPIYPTE